MLLLAPHLTMFVPVARYSAPLIHTRWNTTSIWIFTTFKQRKFKVISRKVDQYSEALAGDDSPVTAELNAHARSECTRTAQLRAKAFPAILSLTSKAVFEWS